MPERASTGATTLAVPGKLLLFGEHAAVYGYPAVGIALNRSIHLTEGPNQPFSVYPALPELAGFPEWVRRVLPAWGLSVPGRVDIHSELPISSGFGSSAALCTGIARLAVIRKSGTAAGAVDQHQVWRVAHELERFFHGTPSGIDTGLSALGGAQLFRFSGGPGALPTAEALTPALPPLVIGALPRERSTRELVAGVRAAREQEPERVDHLLQHLGVVAEEAARTLQRDAAAPGATPAFADAVATAQRLLTDLGVSTDRLDDVIAAGCDAGALAGKLSGAGGGGAYYLVCPDGTTAQRVRDRIRRNQPAGAPCFVMAGSARSDVKTSSEVHVPQHGAVQDHQ